jgi:protein-disulfide isomerase
VLEKFPKEVKIVEKNFPLQMHKFARQAATAALAANKQGKFWEFHKKLFESISSLSDAKVQEIATQLGLDMDKFNKDLKDPAIQNIITRDLQEGTAAGVRGTPTIFVNGLPLANRSLEGFEQAIKQELKKK